MQILLIFREPGPLLHHPLDINGWKITKTNSVELEAALAPAEAEAVAKADQYNHANNAPA